MSGRRSSADRSLFTIYSSKVAMRSSKWIATLAIVSAAALGLGACSSNPSSSEAGPDESSATSGNQDGVPEVNRDPDFELPKVTGGFGEIPQIDTVDAAPPIEITYKLLEPGDGAEVTPNSVVTVNYAGFLWDGKPFDSSFIRGEPATFSLSSVIAGWTYGIPGSRVGDRIQLIVPPEYGYGSTGQGDIPPDATLIFVIDIVDTPGSDTNELESAEFTEESLPDGLLVEGKLGTTPIISFDENSEAPDSSEEVVIAEGKGSIITEEDTVIYHYTAAYWGIPTSADSTWQTGPTTIAARGTLFLGQHVGSRIVMVFPPEEEGKPASVMVVDILAAY